MVWLRCFGFSEPTPRAVFGYCLGAPAAVNVSSRISVPAVRIAFLEVIRILKRHLRSP